MGLKKNRNNLYSNCSDYNTNGGFRTNKLELWNYPMWDQRGDQGKKPSVGATRSGWVERSPGPCWPGVSLQQHRNSLPIEQLQEGPQCPCKEHLVFPAYHTLVELKGLPGWVPSPRTTKGTGPRSISEGMPHSRCRAWAPGPRFPQ